MVKNINKILKIDCDVAGFLTEYYSQIVNNTHLDQHYRDIREMKLYFC